MASTRWTTLGKRRYVNPRKAVWPAADFIVGNPPFIGAASMRAALGERWHGFSHLADGFNMLDPIKATIITPGLDVDGDFADEFGIPAAIVTKYLAEHGVIVEKCGLYSFFIMFTIGITKGRWNTLVTALQQFKDDYDKNQPLWKVLPEFVQKNPRYERVGLRDLCTQIHSVYKHNDVARLTTEMYLSDMVPAMRPADAFAKMAHRDIERVPVDDLEGRVTAVLLTPYPPALKHSARHAGLQLGCLVDHMHGRGDFAKIVHQCSNTQLVAIFFGQAKLGQRPFIHGVHRVGQHHGQFRHTLAVAACMRRFFVNCQTDDFDESFKQMLVFINQPSVGERDCRL